MSFVVQAETSEVILTCKLIRLGLLEQPTAVDLETGRTDLLSVDNNQICVNIDKYKMEQVMRNFLTNALKFTPQHAGGNISVNVCIFESHTNSTARPSASVLRVEVVDNGPGISEVSGTSMQFLPN